MQGLFAVLQGLRQFRNEGYPGDFARLIARGQNDGSICADVDPASEAIFVIAALRGIGYQWLLSPDQFDIVAAAGPEDDISELLDDLEDTVKKVRTGGLLGSGAKAHHKAREKYFELRGTPT